MRPGLLCLSELPVRLLQMAILGADIYATQVSPLLLNSKRCCICTLSKEFYSALLHLHI